MVGEHKDVPFSIKRAFWIFKVAKGAHRAMHAHRSQSQLLVAVNGSFSVMADNGTRSSEFRLDSPVAGLLIPMGMWIDIHDFSDDAVCLVLASGDYDPDEYIRDYRDFFDFVNNSDRD